MSAIYKGVGGLIEKIYGGVVTTSFGRRATKNGSGRRGLNTILTRLFQVITTHVPGVIWLMIIASFTL